MYFEAAFEKIAAFVKAFAGIHPPDCMSFLNWSVILMS